MFKSRVLCFIAVLLGSLGHFPTALFAQDTRPSAAASKPPDQSQPSPESVEERDRQLRQYDPLSLVDDSPISGPDPTLAGPEEQLRQFDPLAGSPQFNPDEERRKEAQRSQKEVDNRLQQEKPVPGSIASANQEAAVAARARGPQIVDDSQSTTPQYTGPAVLSRSYSLNRPVIPQQIAWSETIGFGSSYTSSASTPSTDGTGTVAQPGSLTRSLTWGLSGRHAWRRDSIGVSISGNYTFNAGSGLNTNISVEGTHVVSNRLSFGFNLSESIIPKNYALQNPGLPPGTSLANLDLASSAAPQVFDDGSKSLNGGLSAHWQVNARLSVNASGSYFATIRNSPLLTGVSGQGANGSVNYRFTRRTTVGVFYSFNIYKYPHGFSTSDSHSFGINYSWAIGRSTQLSTSIGTSSTESLALTTVQIDPVLARLLGVTQGTIDLYRGTGGSSISVQATHDFRTAGSATMSYVRGVTPGNGTYATSQQETASLNYGRNYHRYGFSFGANRNTLTSLAQTLGRSTTEGIQVSVSHPYARNLTTSLSYSYTIYELYNAPQLGTHFLIGLNMAWSKGNARLWPPW